MRARSVDTDIDRIIDTRTALSKVSSDEKLLHIDTANASHEKQPKWSFSSRNTRNRIYSDMWASLSAPLPYQFPQ